MPDDLLELRMFALPHAQATEVDQLRDQIDNTLVHT